MLRFMGRFFILTAILLLPALRLLGGEEWSLERCINYALENNVEIMQQQLVLEQNKNNILQSKLSILPNVNGSLNHSMNWGKSVNVQDLQIMTTLAQSTSASLSASMPIFGGLTNINSIKSAGIEFKISEQQIESLKNNITIQITRAYLQLLLAMEIEKVADESFKSTGAQVERTRNMVEAGSQAYSSLLEVESQLANERVQLVSAQNDVKSNYLNLMQILNMPYDTLFRVVPYEPDDTYISRLLPGTVDDIFEEALDLPQIKAAEYSLEKSKVDYKIQKGAAYPSISLSAGYGTYYSDSREGAFFSQFEDNRNPSLGFGMSIPIFNGWRSNTSIRNAKLNVRNAELELVKSHQNLYKEIQQAYNDAINAHAKLEASKKNMEMAAESFKNIENKFNLQMANGTDYTVARANLFKARSEYYQNKFQYIFQLKILDFYRGIPIKL